MLALPVAKRSTQLDAEIIAALAKGSEHVSATVRDWQKRIADLKRQDQRAFYAQNAPQRAVIAQTLKAAQQGLRAARAADKAAQRGLRAARAADKTAKATRPTNVTGANLGALKDLVVKYRSGEFPRGYHAANKHIKRCIAGGLVELIDANGEVTDQIFKGKRLRLTPMGREMVADAIIADISRREGWTPQQLILVPGLSASDRAAVVTRAVAEHATAVQRLEDTLANLLR